VESHLKEIFPLQKLSQKISYLKDQLFDEEKFKKEENIFDRNILQSLFTNYNNKLRILSLVDFDDLVYLPVLLFKDHPSILAGFQARGLHILVDEFQDTSFSQFELLKILSSQDKNIFVVGDDDQSIYSWRGAYPKVLKNFLDVHKETKFIKLEQNYRSAQYILSFANEIIQNNKDRIYKKLWTNIISKSHKISLYEAESERDEGEFVVNHIKAKLKENPLETIGVLMRSNSQVKIFEKVLKEQGIPYSKSFKDDVTDNRDVQNLLAYLKFLYDERDLLSFSKLMSVWKNTFIDNESLENIRSFIEKNPRESLLDIISKHFKEKEHLLLFSKIWRKIKHECTRDEGFDFEKFITECLNSLDFKNSVLLSSASMRSAKKRLSYLETFSARVLKKVSKIEDLKEVFDNFDLNQIESSQDKKNSNVVLMSIHASKGLEFDSVFVVGLEDGILPHERSLSEGLEEEERRLFYVAITRAMQSLFLSYCKFRKETKLGTKKAVSKKSRFLKGLSENYFNFEKADPQSEEVKKMRIAKRLFDLFH
jgi:DNA helicase-2/ATP-dependent DNA helicase PcrA